MLKMYIHILSFVSREGVIKRSHIHQDSFLEKEQACMLVSLEHWPCFSPYREYLNNGNTVVFQLMETYSNVPKKK